MIQHHRARCTEQYCCHIQRASVKFLLWSLQPFIKRSAPLGFVHLTDTLPISFSSSFALFFPLPADRSLKASARTQRYETTIRTTLPARAVVKSVISLKTKLQWAVEILVFFDWVNAKLSAPPSISAKVQVSTFTLTSDATKIFHFGTQAQGTHLQTSAAYGQSHQNHHSPSKIRSGSTRPPIIHSRSGVGVR